MLTKTQYLFMIYFHYSKTITVHKLKFKEQRISEHLDSSELYCMYCVASSNFTSSFGIEVDYIKPTTGKGLGKIEAFS